MRQRYRRVRGGWRARLTDERSAGRLLAGSSCTPWHPIEGRTAVRATDLMESPTESSPWPCSTEAASAARRSALRGPWYAARAAPGRFRASRRSS